MVKTLVTSTAWPGECPPAPGAHDVTAADDARGHGDGDSIGERLLGGEVGLVDEQEVGNVVGSLALLALVGPLQSIRDSSGDFVPSFQFKLSKFIIDVFT